MGECAMKIASPPIAISADPAEDLPMSTDHSQSNMRGAALMTASMAGYTFNDICLKALAGGGVPPLFQAVFLRGIFASLFIYLLARHLGGALQFDLPPGVTGGGWSHCAPWASWGGRPMAS